MCAWKEVSPQNDKTWDPIGNHKEKDPKGLKHIYTKEISGVLVGVKINVGENSSNLYTLDTGEENVGVWGSTVLTPKMSAIETNSKIKIIFEGMKDSPKRKGKQFKDFTVLIDDVEGKLKTPASSEDVPPPPDEEGQSKINPEDIPY